MNGFEMTQVALRMSESGAISIIFEQAIRRFCTVDSEIFA